MLNQEDIISYKTPYETIMNFAIGWCKVQFKEFSSEDLKRAFYGAGNKTIQKPLVFGRVFQVLVNQEKIFKHGFKKAEDKKLRGGIINTYISREFKERQKNNATKDKSLNLFPNE